MRPLRLGRFGAGSAVAVVVVVVASCGSRTGLDVDPRPDASLDATIDATADVVEEPLFEGGKLDVTTDCGKPTYCDPNDLAFVYQCGVRVEQCSSIEQCELGECKNPCVDTLGQDTSNGCEFYPVEMDVTPEVEGACFGVFIVNQWKTGEPARIQVERDGAVLPIEQFARIPTGTGTNITYAPYDAKAGLPKDQIAILFLSRDPAAADDPDPSAPRRLAECPAGVTPAVSGDAAVHGTTVGKAFHIKTNVPVVAYQVLPFGAGRARVTGATLLLPTNAWGTNYVAVNAYPSPTLFTEQRIGPTLAIVAGTDQTHVTINPSVDIVGGPGVAGGAATAPSTYTLDRGQYVQFTQTAELTGSPIESDQPVAVVGGATLMDVPLDRVRADSAEQMLPPVQALGSEYVAVRYRSRDPNAEESVPWRIVGAVNATQLTYEPSTPPGAPTFIGARDVVEFNSPGPFVVHSQDATHPFYMAAYMTGGQPYDGTGDPEFVNVVTPSQYLSRYTFFTDPTYPETNLVIVRAIDPDLGVFPDVKLDCAGTLAGWQPVGTRGRYEFVRVDLSRGDFQPQNGCDNGVHTLEGTFAADGASAVARVGVTVWGWGNPITYAPDNTSDDEANPKFTRWVSYAYPAGANFTKLNDVVVPAK